MAASYLPEGYSLPTPEWRVNTINGLRISTLLVRADSGSTLPLVSVILPTIGRPSLQSAIQTLTNYEYPAFELLIIHDPKRRGSAIARNIGLKMAQGELIHLAEDDCEYLSSNLRLLVGKYLELHKKDLQVAGVVGSFLPAVWGELAVMIKISGSSTGLKTSAIPGEGRTDYLAPGNSLCSKQIILQCGGFNERYSHMFEDIEMSLVLKRHGFTLYNCADAVAQHKNEPRLEKSSGKYLRGTAYLHARNSVLLHRAWCGNPISYVFRQAQRDLRRSILSAPNKESEMDVHRKRTDEWRPALDRLSRLLGMVAGMTSETGRRTIQS